MDVDADGRSNVSVDNIDEAGPMFSTLRKAKSVSAGADGEVGISAQALLDGSGELARSFEHGLGLALASIARREFSEVQHALDGAR